MSAIEIYIFAERLVHQYGRRAWASTVDRAEASAAHGDWGQVATWRRVGAAIRQLEHRAEVRRAKPGLLKYLLGASKGAGQIENPVFG